MARRNQNRSPRSASIKLSLTLCVVAVVLPGLIWTKDLNSQTPSRKRRVADSSQAKPTPTPTGARQDALGEPPPVPLLREKKDQEVNPGDVISVDTTEVMLPVSVRDSSGHLVRDLTRADFRVFEDDREQPLSDLALRQVPVDVLLMVDASSSVAANLDDFRRAAEKLAAQLDPDDRISLIKFDDRVVLLQDWTRSRFQLHRALNRIEAGVFTRFNDALFLAAREQFGATQSRRAMVVLSDGIDTRGATPAERALQALLEAQVTVYVISNTGISRADKRAELDSLSKGSESAVRFNQLRIDDLREGLRALDESEERLGELARATGGRLYKPLSFDTLDEAYREVAEELRRQYAIYYTPLNKTRDGSFRRVRVETSNPDYQTSTRIGYYARHS